MKPIKFPFPSASNTTINFTLIILGKLGVQKHEWKEEIGCTKKHELKEEIGGTKA